MPQSSLRRRPGARPHRPPGIPTRARIATLSRGQRAQVGLTLVLAKRPELLLLEEGVPLAVAVIGALIGAPVVAREIEQRPQLVSWTQSVSRKRWYVTKAVVLAAALAAGALIAGVATGRLQHPLTQGGLTSTRWVWFYSIDLALAGEIVVAFALAAALGAWLRRTLPAVGAPLVAFLPLLLASGWAVRNLTPRQLTTSPSHIAGAGGGWGVQAANGVLSHSARQYWPLHVVFVVLLFAIAAALLTAGWYPVRTRAV